MPTDISSRAKVMAALAVYGNEANDRGQIENVFEMAQRDSVHMSKTTDPKGTWIHHCFSDHSMFSVLVDGNGEALMHQVGRWREET